MTDEHIDGCRIKPYDPQLSDFGKAIGRQLSEGSEQAAQTLSDYINGTLQEQAKGDSVLYQKKVLDFVAGISCTDPTDVYFINHGAQTEYVIDQESESYVNRVFDILNQFSTSPKDGYDPGLTIENAVSNANHFLEVLNTDAPDSTEHTDHFIADFNRRRKNYLPNFEAYKDTTGQARIRSITEL